MIGKEIRQLRIGLGKVVFVSSFFIYVFRSCFSYATRLIVQISIYFTGVSTPIPNFNHGTKIPTRGEVLYRAGVHVEKNEEETG